MEATSILRVLTRDLEALRSELRAYPDPVQIWEVPPGIKNSAGNLALHLVGNLQHFVGAQLGESGYVRERDAEFADRGVPLAEIEARIERTAQVVETTLNGLTEESLSRGCPEAFAGGKLSTELFLIHLATHLAYHLGQVDYHRRLVTGKDVSAGAMGLPDKTRMA